MSFELLVQIPHEILPSQKSKVILWYDQSFDLVLGFGLQIVTQRKISLVHIRDISLIFHPFHFFSIAEIQYNGQIGYLLLP